MVCGRDLSSRDGNGRAFGVERAGDNAGAIIGPLLAADLVSMIGIRQAILLSIIPGEASTGSTRPGPKSTNPSISSWPTSAHR